MVIDHGMILGGNSTEEIAISKFKARCLAVLEQVRRSGQPIRVTRFGKPVAEIVPPAPPKPEGSWLGSMVGTMEISGDIVAPASDPDDWEVGRD